MNRFVILFFILLFFSYPVLAEYIFLKDGSIVSAKIISETDIISKIQVEGLQRSIPRVDILRVRYDSDFYNYMYLKKSDGSIASGYIVEDMSDAYIIRKNLADVEEVKLEKNKVIAVSKEKFFSKGNYYSLGIIPGASQFYVKKDVKGAVFMGSTAAAWSFSGYNFYNYRKQKNEYRNLERGLSLNKYNKKYNDYKKSYRALTASLVLSGSLYLAHWTDVLFFSKPDFSENMVERKKVYFDFKINNPVFCDSSILSARDVDSPFRAEFGTGMFF
jgi:hypothetical protein